MICTPNTGHPVLGVHITCLGEFSFYLRRMSGSNSTARISDKEYPGIGAHIKKQAPIEGTFYIFVSYYKQKTLKDIPVSESC